MKAIGRIHQKRIWAVPDKLSCIEVSMGGAFIVENVLTVFLVAPFDIEVHVSSVRVISPI
jgi:hypothetical protein